MFFAAGKQRPSATVTHCGDNKMCRPAFCSTWYTRDEAATTTTTQCASCTSQAAQQKKKHFHHHYGSLGWKRPQPYAIYRRRPFSVANHSSGRLGNRHNVRGGGHHKARHSRAEQTWLPNTFRPHTCFQWSERFER